jgi:hypothetical protein
MDATVTTTQPRAEELTGGPGVGPVLRRVTGWALLAGMVGIYVDSYAEWFLTVDSPGWLLTVMAPAGLSQGTIGLIPAYLGVTVGLVGLVVVALRIAGWGVAALTALGTLGVMMFWYSYPEWANAGGVGAVVLGVAVLLYPGWGRAASPFWVAGGVLGIPELVTPGTMWGLVASFPLVGTAAGVTGAFVLWGAPRQGRRLTRSTVPGKAPSPGTSR